MTTESTPSPLAAVPPSSGESVLTSEMRALLANAPHCEIRQTTGRIVTTISTGGDVTVISPQTPAAHAFVLSMLKQERIAPVLLSGGSNTLIPDQALSRPLLQPGKGLRSWERRGEDGGFVRIEVGAAIERFFSSPVSVSKCARSMPCVAS